MKQKLKIHLTVFLLLALYVFSSVGVSFFHHHSEEVLSYKQVTSCEKAIYFSQHNDECHHQSHISTVTEKCVFCHTPSVAAHVFNQFQLHQTVVFNVKNYTNVTSDYVYHFYSRTLNKGPPLV